jgi:nitrogen fixation/metabolism regulation signal transduction histidine kinase
MQKMSKRHFLGRGKAFLTAPGAQYRFIMFLILLLIAYTVLLRVFQKIAEIVQLPVFLPIALVTLLIFIGIVGILYSHTFVGPLTRIRKALDLIAEGDMNVSVRLRDSDDPALKELVEAISRLCENSRNSHALVQETASDLFADLRALKDKISNGAGAADLQTQMNVVRKKQELLEKAIKAFGKK